MPIWELVERAGSYVAPIALAALVVVAESTSSGAMKRLAGRHET